MGFQLPTSTGELTTRISAIKPVSPLFRGGIRGGVGRCNSQKHPTTWFFSYQQHRHVRRKTWTLPNEIILVTSWWLKNISQNGNLPQIGMNTKKHFKPPPRDIRFFAYFSPYSCYCYTPEEFPKTSDQGTIIHHGVLRVTMEVNPIRVEKPHSNWSLGERVKPQLVGWNNT